MHKTFKIGDVVEITYVNEDDKILGRYVGEQCIFQGFDLDDVDTCLVRFENFGEYFIKVEQIKFIKSATIETIFEAFDELKGNEELVNRIKDFIETKE